MILIMRLDVVLKGASMNGAFGQLAMQGVRPWCAIVPMFLSSSSGIARTYQGYPSVLYILVPLMCRHSSGVQQPCRLFGNIILSISCPSWPSTMIGGASARYGTG